MMSFTYRLFRGAAVLLLALSAAIATPAIEFVLTGGDLYPMRWGLVEGSNDDVLPPHSVGGPITCKKGITPSLIVTRRTTDPEIVWWQVLSASLKNKSGTVTYWTIGQSPQLSPGQSWPLGKMRPRKPPAWHPNGSSILWELINYWYTGSPLGLVASPPQFLPPAPTSLVLGQPVLTTSWAY